MILRIKIVGFFIFLVALLTNVYAQEQENILFTKGNELYKNAKYSEAILEYEKVNKNGFKSPELFYNLGNSYYNNDQLGFAILNYEKALKLKPSFDNAKFNLSIAQKSVVDKIETIPEIGFVKLLKSVTGLMHTDTWSWITILSLFIVGISVIYIRLNKESKLNKYALIKVFVFLIIGALSFLFAQLSYHYQKPEAILINPNTYVKNGPSSTSKDLFVLHEGIKVEILEENKNWIQVKLSDGLIGWANKKDFKNI